MDNVWLKLIIAIVVIAAVVVGISYLKGLKPKEPKPKERERTVGDVMREDEQRLRAEPNIPTTETGEPKIKFRELTVEEQAGAEQLFEMAITSRKMGRLPGITYGQMVNYCREIIEKYPGSEFDYKARGMLGEVPREQWDRYHITEQEINGFKQTTE